VSGTPSEGPAKGGRYHHGDLKAALIDVAISLIAERGVREFSLAEASRRLGVTVAAPYRHFADRDDLLAAVGVRALDAFAAALAAEGRDTDPPEQRLAALARAYVRFAGEQRPLFATLFVAGIDKSRYPEFRRAFHALEDTFRAAALEICEHDAKAADALMAAAEATAHGHAALLLDGSYDEEDDPVGSAADQAASATLALIQGRSALRRPS
jgi:AcrR family transcriptional regulator